MDYETYKRNRLKKSKIPTTKKRPVMEDKTRRYAIFLVSRVLICVVVLLGVLIISKVNTSAKMFLKEHIYEDQFPFAKFHSWYEKNIGKLFPSNDDKKTTPVFQEKIVYEEASVYKDGVSLKVGSSYLVPVIESGIIVFMGEKEGYGNTIIVQQVNGVDVWYGNTKGTNLKLYDYVEKGKLLGESMSDVIYVVFQKEGAFLDYKNYLT